MLTVASRLNELDFRQLMDVYEEGNLENAEEFFPHVPKEQGILMAEQNFHQYLRECFFKTEGARYYVCSENDRYISALRLEPYRDGLLLEALETRPDARKKGYAEALVKAVLEQVGTVKVYSHVHKKNIPSLKVHEKCGFFRILEHAVYADGSVYSNCCTFCSQK